jgi:hypothetical protein
MLRQRARRTAVICPLAVQNGDGFHVRMDGPRTGSTRLSALLVDEVPCGVSESRDDKNGNEARDHALPLRHSPPLA